METTRYPRRVSTLEDAFAICQMGMSVCIPACCTQFNRHMWGLPIKLSTELQAKHPRLHFGIEKNSSHSESIKR